MLNWLQHQILVKKGLACDKTRRQRSDATWLESIDGSAFVRLAIFALFAALLFFINFWQNDAVNNEQHLLIFIVFFSSVMLLQMDQPDIWDSNFRISLIYGVIWFNLFLSKFIFVYAQLHQNMPPAAIYYLLPGALAPFCIALLMGQGAGLYTVLNVSLLSALLLDQSFSLLIISLITGFTAVYFLREVRKRGDLIRAGIAVGVSSLICAIAFGWITRRSFDALMIHALLGIGAGIVTALVVSAVLPILETAFGIITDISWIEMADLNHPLLQQMTIEAPGTYHHSLVVANLMEAAAVQLGLNPTQCRVMAYFHDIGKIIKPEYFSENCPPDRSPHLNLSPSMSALIIIAHVKEGVDLALKFRLKKPIIDAIQQHHGDSLVYYFYKRAKQLEADAREGGKIMNMREEDIPEVSENSFRYPGPRPQSKEVGVLCMADAIEAASRTLERPSPQRVEGLVNEIIERRIAEGMLDETGLTLKEIRIAADSFVFTIKNMMHSRIVYPKDDTKEKSPFASSSQSTKKSSSFPPSSSAAA
jgi:cyclic-di-AMP phosphodiesterase PgpH